MNAAAPGARGVRRLSCDAFVRVPPSLETSSRWVDAVQSKLCCSASDAPCCEMKACPLDGSLHGSVSACEMERYRMDQVIQHELHRLRLRGTFRRGVVLAMASPRHAHAKMRAIAIDVLIPSVLALIPRCKRAVELRFCCVRALCCSHLRNGA